MRTIFILLVVVVSVIRAKAEQLPLYIGTGGDGIFLSQFDTETGTLSEPTRVATTPRPTFLWVRSDRLYSVCELGRTEGDVQAAIVAWKIDGDSGQLKELSKQDAMGAGPCFVAASGDGKYAAVANYGGGSVALFPVGPDGSVGKACGFVQHTGSSVNKRRQAAPHAHSSRFTPDDGGVVAADLGTDKVYRYQITDNGKLKPASPPWIQMPAGSGPRHLVFSPDEQYLLVLGELSGTITTVQMATPEPRVGSTISTMADGVLPDAPRGSAEILFHPNGKWVYCSNRGPNEIAVFRYQSGELTRTSAISSGGNHPRNFRFSPDGKFLLVANQRTNNIVVFRIDQKTGKLTATGNELVVDQPMCLKFLTEEK